MSTIVANHQQSTAATGEPAPASVREFGQNPMQLGQSAGRNQLVLFPLRLFLALGWIRAGVEKLIEADWWTGQALTQFLQDQAAEALPFTTPAIGLMLGWPTTPISLVVMLLEIVIGVCLVTGRHLRPALWAACTLNVCFVVLGVVSPSAFYLVMQATLLFGLAPPRPRAARSTRAQFRTPIALAVASFAFLPFVQTLHPHEVIEDPALMLSTIGLLSAATLTIATVERS